MSCAAPHQSFGGPCTLAGSNGTSAIDLVGTIITWQCLGTRLLWKLFRRSLAASPKKGVDVYQILHYELLADLQLIYVRYLAHSWTESITVFQQPLTLPISLSLNGISEKKKSRNFMLSLELELSRKERLMRIDGNKQHIRNYRWWQLKYFFVCSPLPTWGNGIQFD